MIVKDAIYKRLKRSWSVTKALGHSYPFKTTKLTRKRSFIPILLIYLYLPITIFHIYLRKILGLRQVKKKVIYYRNRILKLLRNVI